MPARNFAKHPVGSLLGLACGLATGVGAVLALSGRGGLGALVILTSFALLLVTVVIGVRKRKPGDTL